MLTIGQLASYAGVTVRTVRHYHQRGLLPEPERDASGYRRYGAQDVVQLIRIRTLAGAGVPLARVQELLHADDEQLAEAVADIDSRLRAEIRQLEEHRERIARLAAGDSLVLPREVTDYLQRLRELGIPERIVNAERDAWILVAARWPDLIAPLMADKHRQLDDARTLWFYRTIGEAIDWEPDDPRLIEIADHVVEMIEEADAPEHERYFQPAEADTGFVELMDSMFLESTPVARRLVQLIEQRGWRGWTKFERISPAETPQRRRARRSP